MTPLVLVLFALSAGATTLAWLVAGRRPEHRPIAWLLTYGLASDVARQLLRDLVLVPGYAQLAGAPAAGSLRAAFHLEQALFVGWPFGIAALAVSVLARRRPWPLIIPYAALVAVLVLGYPTVRHLLLRQIYLGVELAALCLAIGCLATWYLSTRPRTIEHIVAALLVAMEAAMITGGPYRGILFLAWDRAWAILLVLYPALILLEGWVWFRSRASGSR